MIVLMLMLPYTGVAPRSAGVWPAAGSLQRHVASRPSGTQQPLPPHMRQLLLVHRQVAAGTEPRAALADAARDAPGSLLVFGTNSGFFEAQKAAGSRCAARPNPPSRQLDACI
jgi:hypothetical protein